MPNCNECGDPKAVLGFNQFYCPNEKCRNFDEQRLSEVLEEAEEQWGDAWSRLDLELAHALSSDFYEVMQELLDELA